MIEDNNPDVWSTEKDRIERLIEKLFRISSYVSELKKYELLELSSYFMEVKGIPIEDPYNHIVFEVTDIEHLNADDGRFTFEKHQLSKNRVVR